MAITLSHVGAVVFGFFWAGGVYFGAEAWTAARRTDGKDTAADVCDCFNKSKATGTPSLSECFALRNDREGALKPLKKEFKKYTKALESDSACAWVLKEKPAPVPAPAPTLAPSAKPTKAKPVKAPRPAARKPPPEEEVESQLLE